MSRVFNLRNIISLDTFFITNSHWSGINKTKPCFFTKACFQKSTYSLLGKNSLTKYLPYLQKYLYGMKNKVISSIMGHKVPF